MAWSDLPTMQPSSFQTRAPRRAGAAAKLSALGAHISRAFSELSGPEVAWNRTTYLALATLAGLWAALMFSTWSNWGELTADCGREMYVPVVLSEGKMLYRDIWFLNGPIAPYLNAYLFRIFGVHLNVLYWAGSITALGSAFFLYVIGMRLSSWIVGWTVGAIVLVQAFQPGLFCFPLPYSYNSAYGCLTACIFLWFTLRACTSSRWPWMFGAGSAAAVALLLKLEFGSACYAALALLIAARWLRERTWKRVLVDFCAILPGVALCAAVVGWMISIAGVDFITQENMLSWPTSYFMRTYGKYWLVYRGFNLSGMALAGAILRTGILAAVLIGLYLLLRRAPSERSAIFLAAELGVAGLAFVVSNLSWQARMVFRWIFFPQDMVLYVAVAAIVAWWYFWRQPSDDRRLQIAILLSFSGLLAFRILFLMNSAGYPIYYNGPVLIGFLLLVSRVIIPQPAPSPRFISQTEVLVCFACLTAVAFQSIAIFSRTSNFVPMTTERGTIRVSKQSAENHLAAIEFMKEQAAKGESVLSIPEDTSLYFFSATHCPTRVYVLSPGVLSPGRMTDEFIQEIERKRVRYLIWSNRDFPEYRVHIFGTDFDQTVGDYFRSHYRPLRGLPDDSPDWDAVIWERQPEDASR